MLKKQSEMAEEERLENDLEELNHIVEPDQNTLRKIQSIESTLRHGQLQKAEGARIRARVKHATEGKRNTAFFFRQEKQHAKAKSVSQVRTKDGSIQSSEEKPVPECMAKFYESLFKSEQPSTQDQSAAEWRKSLATPARPEELSNLEGGLSIEELRKALTSMQGGKSPGIDGLPKEFYVAFWQLVGEDLNQVLQGSIEHGELPLSMRRAVISPIFKKGDKTLLENWRPISLLNTDYKILTKALTNRLKEVIISLVEPDQTGFIPGRLIQTNISTVRDLIDYMEETTGRSGALIFLDWEKAYDRLERSFLEKAMVFFGIPEPFIKQVKTIYQNTLAAVQYNGRVSRFFEVSRGVRQGCPLSLLLYVLGAEILARAIRENKKIKGIPTGKNQRFKISQFADDTALGVESEEEIKEVEKTIQHFEKESGARLNREKTCAMGLREWSRDSTGQSFKWVNQRAYLGVFVGKDMLQAIKDTWQKVTRKLKTAVNLWKARTLSLRARGKALVINTCMVSRTVYTASVFPMPTETLTEINKVIWPFLWNNSPDLVPREQATRRLSEGGLGIVDIPDKVRSIEIRAIEIFRAAAVEYDRKGETVLDRASRAKARSRNQYCWNPQEWPGRVKTEIQKRDQDQSARFLGIRGKGTEVCNRRYGRTWRRTTKRMDGSGLVHVVV